MFSVFSIISIITISINKILHLSHEHLEKAGIALIYVTDDANVLIVLLAYHFTKETKTVVIAEDTAI